MYFFGLHYHKEWESIVLSFPLASRDTISINYVPDFFRLSPFDHFSDLVHHCGQLLGLCYFRAPLSQWMFMSLVLCLPLLLSTQSVKELPLNVLVILLPFSPGHSLWPSCMSCPQGPPMKPWGLFCLHIVCCSILTSLSLSVLPLLSARATQAFPFDWVIAVILSIQPPYQWVYQICWGPLQGVKFCILKKYP